MKILLVQPDWPKPSKIKDPQKYFPLPLIKLAALYRKNNNSVALIIGNNKKDIPFVPDKICVTTVFSWWFKYAKECIESYHFLFPEAKIEIGGVHASLMPEIYKENFPYAQIHIGTVEEAEKLEPAYDLLPDGFDTQIIRFSQGCIRRCSFCYSHLEGYKAYSWDNIAPKIKYNRLILNDNNFLAHKDAETILSKLAAYKVNRRNISSIEIQGGFDVRILHKNLHFISLFKEARVKNIRLAFDGELGMAYMVEKCLNALLKAGYHLRDIRCYCLYNHDISFETIVKKLELFEKWKLGPIHSRFRPVWLLEDGYIPQKRSQGADKYYIHKGWSDSKVRAVGSLASDISRMSRAGVNTLDEVRAYYGKPLKETTLNAVSSLN